MPKPLLIILLVLISIFFLLFLYSIVRALIYKNKEPRVYRLPSKLDEKNEEYANKLLSLLSIKIKDYVLSKGSCQFIEKIDEYFPQIAQQMTQERLGSHLILTYFPEDCEKKILFVVNRGLESQEQAAYLTDTEIFGEGSYGKKATLFACLQAIEESFIENKDLKLGISIVATIKKTITEKDNENIAEYFLKRGLYFDLVLKEGPGIIDPTFLELKSHHAIIGLGVTGEVEIRYRVQKTEKSQEMLTSFIEQIKQTNVFKTKVDIRAFKLLSALALDMPFYNRFIFSNILIYLPLVKRLIKHDETELSRMLKTTAYFDKITELDDCYCCDVNFKLSHYDSVSEITKALSSYVEKYGIDYEIKTIKEASKITSTSNAYYKLFKEYVSEYFKDIYIAPHVLTRTALQLQLSNISDCVIWFSPLYYPQEAIIDANNQNEHILKASLSVGIGFYKKIIEEFRSKDVL